MEEKKSPIKPVEQKKLTYDELNKACADLHQQYQRLAAEYQKAMQALNNRQFDYMSFFLQMLFKVLEHPENYNKEFAEWAAQNVEQSLTSFAEFAGQASETEKKSEAKENEAE